MSQTKKPTLQIIPVENGYIVQDGFVMGSAHMPKTWVAKTLNDLISVIDKIYDSEFFEEAEKKKNVDRNGR